MSYAPTEWETGDVITAEKLNNMESGILNAPGVAVFEFEVIADNDNQVITTATVQDVIDAFSAGRLCVARICVRNSAQPAVDSMKEDFIFNCLAKYEFLTAKRNEISSNNENIRIYVRELSWNGSSWTFSKNEYYVQSTATNT